MEDSSLQMTPWPNDIDPHRCGSAPFVPDVSGPEQNSCGSYKDSFGPGGCSIYRPNYPDDRYLEQNGCEGLKDCHNNISPDSPEYSLEPNRVRWPVGGFVTQATQADCVGCGDVSVENFESYWPFSDTRCGRTLFVGIVWLLILFFILKLLKLK